MREETASRMRARADMLHFERVAEAQRRRDFRQREIERHEARFRRDIAFALSAAVGVLLAIMAALYVFAPGEAKAFRNGGELMLDCYDTEALRVAMQKLEHKPVWSGIDAAGQLVVVWQAPKGDWSIVISPQPGQTCLFSFGGSGGESTMDGRGSSPALGNPA